MWAGYIYTQSLSGWFKEGLRWTPQSNVWSLGSWVQFSKPQQLLLSGQVQTWVSFYCSYLLISSICFHLLGVQEVIYHLGLGWVIWCEESCYSQVENVNKIYEKYIPLVENIWYRLYSHVGIRMLQTSGSLWRLKQKLVLRFYLIMPTHHDLVIFGNFILTASVFYCVTLSFNLYQTELETMNNLSTQTLVCSSSLGSIRTRSKNMWYQS